MGTIRKSFAISKKTLASFPRIHLNVILVIAAVCFSSVTFAQRKNDVSGSIPEKVQNTNYINNLNMVYNSGKVYINWMVKGEMNDGIYLIERSTDGSNFNAIGFKEVVASGLELLYSWIDAEPATGTAFYRLARIGQDYEQEVMTAAIPILNIGDGINKVNTASTAGTK